MTREFYSLAALKAQAKALRQSAPEDQPITHSQSLEQLAQSMGYANWNILRAKSGVALTPLFQIGQILSGQYLGHDFSGKVITASADACPDRIDLRIRFDKPLDVSAFESMQIFRRQIRATVDLNGTTIEHTSNGKPQLQITMV
jgi:hypothetical protein